MLIRWSDQARDDLRGILSYVGENFGRRKAEEVLADILDRAELLRRYPSLGQVFVKDPDLAVTYRSLSSKLNKIVHYVDGDAINIVTVWQNRQDIGRLKRSMTK